MSIACANRRFSFCFVSKHVDISPMLTFSSYFNFSVIYLIVKTMVILKIAIIAHLWGLFEITKYLHYKLREIRLLMHSNKKYKTL